MYWKGSTTGRTIPPLPRLPASGSVWGFEKQLRLEPKVIFTSFFLVYWWFYSSRLGLHLLCHESTTSRGRRWSAQAAAQRPPFNRGLFLTVLQLIYAYVMGTMMRMRWLPTPPPTPGTADGGLRCNRVSSPGFFPSLLQVSLLIIIFKV